MKSLLIKGYSSPGSEGITLHFNKKFSMNGGIKTDKIWVSWDKIGKALCGDEYCDTGPLDRLDEIRVSG